MTARNRGVIRASDPEPLQKKGPKRDPRTAEALDSARAARTPAGLSGCRC